MLNGAQEYQQKLGYFWHYVTPSYKMTNQVPRAKIPPSHFPRLTLSF